MGSHSHHQYEQEPVAIVGFACRLPGGNTNPRKLWEFLRRGGIASNDVPGNRFNLHGHWDGSLKPRTMRPLGGMFLEDLDPADFDAPFFEISRTEAIAMDPNQRQMLEVVYEGLENAGITLERLNGALVGCFTGSYASDYDTMQSRDPEDRPAGITVGVGRSILTNRLSHFLNLKGPSMTIDTACSGSLIGLDIACRYLQSREIDAAIVATSNLYLNPEHVMDTAAVGNAHSPTGLCHTFDISADGYVKAEAVSAVIVKRLADALRDGDPVRAVIRGTSTNSDGRTPGIASPSAEAQAAAIRAAYANAGITDLNDTGYLECHGTGTPAGDPTEVGGAASVFSPTRSPEKPLIIGSIKSNVGHAEPAAGISGLVKAVLSIENGIIPGNPTFENPNPKIDFAGWKVKASRTEIAWPPCKIRRASINSFGYGGSNAHAVLEQADAHVDAEAGLRHVSSYLSEDDDDFLLEGGEDGPYRLLVFSANDETSLRANVKALSDHLANPRVRVTLGDLAYTLSERRSRLFHRGFVVTARSTELDERGLVLGKKSSDAPRVGFVFTGQGAQWPEMGKELLQAFPLTRAILVELDQVLQSLPNPPAWSLLRELTEPRSPQHLRDPEFSQPLVTALQLCILAVLETWGITTQSVVGHSSGEMAAAYAAGLISRADAMTAAFYRGRAAVNRRGESEKNVGMLAVGLGADELEPHLTRHQGDAWVACYNSPNSVTVSGRRPALEALQDDVKRAGHFARMLHVDLAYHSGLMRVIGDEYEQLLADKIRPLAGREGVSMFSSVTGARQSGAADALYWKTNMISPVRFDEAAKAMLSQEDSGPNFLVEIGPSGALAGPISQIRKSLSGQGGHISYCAAWARDSEASKALYNVAGKLFVAGGDVDLALVNEYHAAASERPRTIVDLPNYVWNHSTKYWHENEASKDWRFKKFVNHDLLGSKVLGTSWNAPTWRKLLSLDDVPWLRDHKMGSDVLMPGSGFIAMALEAVFQKSQALDGGRAGTNSAALHPRPDDFSYRFRNVRFEKALVLDEGKDASIVVSLTQQPGSKDWHEFRVSSSTDGLSVEHCRGLVRIQDPVDDVLAAPETNPLESPTAGRLWYKAKSEVGYGFGPAFQKLLQVESVSGQRRARSLVSLTAPPSKWSPQSCYPIHPAALDACFQTVTPPLWAGERSSLNAVVVPSIVDSLVINKVPAVLGEGLSVAETVYSGRGRLDEARSYFANCSVHDPATGAMIVQLAGLRFAKIDMAAKVDPHTFELVSWKPDITFLSDDQLVALPAATPWDKVQLVLDLIAHKRPMLKVLEIGLDSDETSSTWFGGGDARTRSAYAAYTFASTDAKNLVAVESRHETARDAEFHLLDPTKPAMGLPESSRGYNLVIVRSAEPSGVGVEQVLAGLRSRTENRPHVLVVQQDSQLQRIPATGSSSGSEVAAGPFEMPVTPAEASSPFESPSSDVDTRTPASSLGDDEGGRDAEKHIALLGDNEARREVVVSEPAPPGLGWQLRHPHNALEIAVDDAFSAYLLTLSGEEDRSEHQAPPARSLHIVHLGNSTPDRSHHIRKALQQSGWDVTEDESDDGASAERFVTSADAVLVLDELHEPLLSRATPPQWEAVQALVGAGKQLLWLTRDSQLDGANNPESALVQGLFRVARMEDVSARLATLDVADAGADSTGRAISNVLTTLVDGAGEPRILADHEFAERGGVIYVPRLVPDGEVNRFRTTARAGGDIVSKGLHETESPVALRAERMGTFQGLVWAETSTHEIPVAAGKVEVEVAAAGVNFKDVAVTMGIIPENEYTLGYEGSGVVKRLGPGVTKFREGDRVCFLCNGSYANRLQVPVGRAHVIPEWMTFEEAATIPSVFLASIYSLLDIADLKHGQSVLIHSAAGGVGLSAIQIARYKKAEIFVTVGTEEKRRFLCDKYGIPSDHVFSSRDTDFAKRILHMTHGRGVDVILNSLTGEMLDESWRICADGGTFVEIGKKDIVDRNSLSMEPFERNCSFRAMDFSYSKDISDSLIDRLLNDIFDLIDGGHLRPIHPITTFGFDDVPSALAHIRGGRHIGKIVISSGQEDVKVPIRPAVSTLELRPDASYLIVGGLKGLCGNLAIHMASHGARRIIVCSRSGLADTASQKTARNCRSYGCEIVEAKGDVADEEFVQNVFNHAWPPIAGVIQGAMILRDKPLETMTHQDYHAAIRAKIRGTWALHRASLRQPRALDFLTLISSISGTIGKKGQANYSAASTFLDAFAAYRRGLGLRCHAVDLGLVEDVGYVAEQGGMDVHFDKRQWIPILEGTLRQILTISVLLQQSGRRPIRETGAAGPAQLVTGIGYPLPEDSDMKRDARFAYHFAAGGGGGVGGSTDGAGGGGDQALRAFRMMRKSGADVGLLAGMAQELLAAQFGRILRLETPMEPAKPLMAYGLDSLAAVELRNWVRSELGAELTVLDITNAVSLIALCGKLVAKLPVMS
ncbi:putative polyketide synthase protein [Staphylotrichum tortipilum]|uniref:Polyketide synthase protein n=1 Tax=Staphylotrichum tortipilum TaxID=2831512 RepID=A0AAN6RV05_9PEZI|nr:putative polyketide synthase protein [Staphylotrichum longicolle]